MTTHTCNCGNTGKNSQNEICPDCGRPRNWKQQANDSITVKQEHDSNSDCGCGSDCGCSE